MIKVPPLSARTEDILPIVTSCAVDFLREHGERASVEIDDNVLDLLTTYSWPGNIRELRGVTERAVVHAGIVHGHVRIQVPHLPERIRMQESSSSGADAASILSTELVEAALRRAGGNQSEAARQLGVHRNTIGRYLRAAG